MHLVNKEFVKLMNNFFYYYFSVTLAMICAFGLGFGDACYNTQVCIT